MRINYKNYPVLKCLIPNNKLEILVISERDKDLAEAVRIALSGCKDEVRSQIVKYSRSFISKIGDKKIFDKIDEALGKESFAIDGTFIVDERIYFCCCDYNNGESKGLVLIMHEYGYMESVMIDDKIYISDTALQLYRNHPTGLSAEDLATSQFHKFFLINLLQKYAQVETKIIQPNEKHKIDKDNIFNETQLPITYIDSTWFTNLVVSGAFGVKGHFRLQPKKDEKGEWTKELIWIKDFEKQGYHRRAKILNEGIENEQI